MIKIKRKNLIKSTIGITAIIVSTLIISMFVFAKKIEINISKENIMSAIQSQLPLSKTIDINSKIPLGLENFKNKIENPTILVNYVTTEFKNDEININTIANILINNKNYSIYINSTGKPLYKNGEFFFQANSIKITPEKEYSDIFKENLINKENNSLKNSIKNKLIEESFKNNNINNTFNVSIENTIEKILINVLEKKSIYKLDDSLQSSSIRIGLDDIKITENGINIIISIQKIMIFGFVSLLFIFGMLGFIYYLIKNPTDVILGFIEISVDVLEAVAEGTGEVLGGLA